MRPDREFWKAIYKPETFYFSELVTGWIADLFPYLGDPPQRTRNRVFSTDRQGWGVPARQGITPKSFPSGFSQAPMRIIFPDGTEHQTDVMAGFFAVGKNESDRAVFPVIGWSVVEGDAIAANWEALARRFPTAPKPPDTPVDMEACHLELAHFAGRFAWMDLPLANGKWRIVPTFRLKDTKHNMRSCFAYDCDAIERNQPGRALALSVDKRVPEAPVQTVHLCDLRPGYDPRTWDFQTFAMGRTSPVPEITAIRVLQGDLFTFLNGLIEREGAVE